MKRILSQSLLDEFISETTTKKNILGATLCVEKGDQTLSLTGAAGNIAIDDSYYIASVTKLYMTTVLLQLRAENLLQLEDEIHHYLPKKFLKGIHVLDGVDYSKEITIKHLMANRSGIPDYFSSRVFSELIAGKDQSFPIEAVLETARQLKPKFKPAQKGKAQYSDTNYSLLGYIIETITGKSIHTVFKERIFTELNLEETYVYEDINDSRPVPLNYKGNQLHLPLYLVSISSEGGIVSTAKETMVFLKAFFNGRFFPKEDFIELEKWNLLFSPGVFFYGVGISRQPLSLVGIKKGLIGHWGQTGAFAFHHPETDLYFSGTINQVTGHSVAARLMTKIIKLYK